MAEVFIDTDVALDIILQRVPHFGAAQNLIDLGIEGEVELCLSESCLPNLVYITVEIYKARWGIEKITELIEGSEILSAPKSIVLQALRSDFKDKEDAIQYYTALHHHCDFFITRNIKDYKSHASASLPAMTPVDFLKTHYPKP